jgi:two-component system, chemotaxis family, sensor kinase Cph1
VHRNRKVVFFFMYNSIEKLVLGDHAAMLSRTRAEAFDSAVPFVVFGLERGERCLYMAGEEQLPQIQGALECAGVDVEREVRRGALSIISVQAFYLPNGAFEPEKVIGGIEAEVATTLKQGFKGLRGVSDMSVTLQLPGVLKRVLEYEQGLDRRFPKRGLALCQYDEAGLSGTLLAELIFVHPIVIARGEAIRNPWYRLGNR